MFYAKQPSKINMVFQKVVFLFKSRFIFEPRVKNQGPDFFECRAFHVRYSYVSPHSFDECVEFIVLSRFLALETWFFSLPNKR